MATTYRASPTKRRRRRSKAQITKIADAMFEVIEAERPMTVRQVFYRMVSLSMIDKSETEYNGTVCRLLTKMRREGRLPYDWLSDATRWQRKPNTHYSLETMLEQTARLYRRDLWQSQDVYVEIWLEKEALAGVLYDVTGQWDVPLMVTRGYPSLSYLHSAAEAMQYEAKPSFLYYFGDHDPSGVDIPRKVERDLRQFAPDVELYFQRVAVTPEQIDGYTLPTRPTKKTDTRSKSFVGESVEVDAIPPDTLRQLAENCIIPHIDQDALERTRLVEEAERDTLQTIIAGLDPAA